TVMPSVTTTYYVHITDMCDGSATDSITVTVNPIPEVDIGNDTTICYGETVTLNAGSGYLGYLWQDGSIDSTLTVDTTGVYWVEVTGIGGCTAIDSVIVNLFPISIVDLGNDTTICFGDTIIFNAGSGFTNYLWQDGSVDSTFTVDTTGVYWVIVTDTNGCAASDTVFVTTSPPPVIDLGCDTSICYGETFTFNVGTGFLTYLWQDGSTGNSYTADTEGWYWVTVSNNCGYATDSIYLTVNPLPEINFGNDTSICINNNFWLEPGYGYISYLWQNGTSDPYFEVEETGTYWVKVIDDNGCSNKDTINIVVSDPIVNLGDDKTICFGDTVIFEGGFGFSSYLWQDGSVDSIYFAYTEGTYSLEVTDSIGCIADDQVNLFMLYLPVIDLVNDTSICIGDNITFDAGSGYLSYLWQDGSDEPTFTAYSAGTYWVNVSNVCGTVSDTVILSNYPNPPLNLGNDTIISFGETIILDAGTGFVSYIWQDGSSDSIYTVTEEGMYWVNIFDGFCYSTDSIYIEHAPCDILIPNVFTPNSDGSNDKFYAESTDVLKFEILIYNRWGEKVFESNNINAKWDGKHNGNQCPEGVYYWVAKIECTGFDTKRTLKGSVTILR
ncbi:MAG: gliding motility-associated C-terminal domain-containing protein, partial [Bacteroidales bacterium]|nr:gliding motility-associated C-terminal domain-containing protein [Bacteroidales bacterium]